MNEKSLYNLYTAVSATLDVGTYEEYKQRMLDKNNRKKLYDMASPKFNLGTYEEYENRLSSIIVSDYTDRARKMQQEKIKRESIQKDLQQTPFSESEAEKQQMKITQQQFDVKSKEADAKIEARTKELYPKVKQDLKKYFNIKTASDDLDRFASMLQEGKNEDDVILYNLKDAVTSIWNGMQQLVGAYGDDFINQKATRNAMNIAYQELREEAIQKLKKDNKSTIGFKFETAFENLIPRVLPTLPLMALPGGAPVVLGATVGGLQTAGSMPGATLSPKEQLLVAIGVGAGGIQMTGNKIAEKLLTKFAPKLMSNSAVTKWIATEVTDNLIDQTINHAQSLVATGKFATIEDATASLLINEMTNTMGGIKEQANVELQKSIIKNELNVTKQDVINKIAELEQVKEIQKGYRETGEIKPIEEAKIEQQQEPIKQQEAKLDLEEQVVKKEMQADIDDIRYRLSDFLEEYHGTDKDKVEPETEAEAQVGQQRQILGEAMKPQEVVDPLSRTKEQYNALVNEFKIDDVKNYVEDLKGLLTQKDNFTVRDLERALDTIDKMLKTSNNYKRTQVGNTKIEQLEKTLKTKLEKLNKLDIKKTIKNATAELKKTTTVDQYNDVLESLRGIYNDGNKIQSNILDTMIKENVQSIEMEDGSVYNHVIGNANKLVDVDVLEKQLSSLDGKRIQDLTKQELETMNEVIDILKEANASYIKDVRNEAIGDIPKLRDEVVDQINEVGKFVNKGYSQNEVQATIKMLKNLVTWIEGQILKPDVIGIMVTGKDNNAIRKIFWDDVLEGSHIEKRTRKQAEDYVKGNLSKRIADWMNQEPTRQQIDDAIKGIRLPNEIKEIVRIGGENIELTLDEQMAIVAYMGNAKSLKSMLDGGLSIDRYAQESKKTIKPTIEELIAISDNLKQFYPEELNAIRTAWDVFDTIIYPQMNRVEEVLRARKLPFEERYFPILRDESDLYENVTVKRTANSNNLENARYFQDRKRTDIPLVIKGFSEVYAGAVKDTTAIAGRSIPAVRMKTFLSPKVKNALDEAFGKSAKLPAYLQERIRVIEGVSPTQGDAAAQILGKLTKNVVKGVLGAKIFTGLKAAVSGMMIKNIAYKYGIEPSEMGIKKFVNEMIKNPKVYKEAIKEIKDNSPILYYRMLGEGDQTLSSYANIVELSNLKKLYRLNDKAIMYFIREGDNLVTASTYMLVKKAYEKRGLTGDDLKNMTRKTAESMIEESQPSSVAPLKSNLSKSAVGQWLSLFQSGQIATFNNLMYEAVKFKRKVQSGTYTKKDAQRFASTIFTTMVAVPMAMQLIEYWRDLAKGKDVKITPKKLASDVVIQNVEQTPVVGDFIVPAVVPFANIIDPYNKKVYRNTNEMPGQLGILLKSFNDALKSKNTKNISKAIDTFIGLGLSGYTEMYDIMSNVINDEIGELKIQNKEDIQTLIDYQDKQQKKQKEKYEKEYSSEETNDEMEKLKKEYKFE